MGLHNHTTEAGRHPYLRQSFWADGKFDFLFTPFMSEAYRARLQAIKDDAIAHVKGTGMHYPNLRKSNKKSPEQFR